MAIKRYRLQYNNNGVQETIYLETDGHSVMLDDGTNVQTALDSHRSSITNLSSSIDGLDAMLDDLNGEVI